MKKIILSIMLTVACLTDMQAQTASQLFSQFRHEKNAEYTHVPAVMWKVFKSLVGKEDKEARFFMKHIRSIRTLDMEDCSQQVKAKFHSAVGRLKTSGYTELIRSNEDDERTMILVKEKRGKFRELLIVESSEDDCQLVQIKGKISPDEVEKIVAENKK